METYLNSATFVIAFTFLVYYGAQVLQKKTGLITLNPILVSVAIIIVSLKSFKIQYESYHEGCKLIDFFLKPAIVALGVPLYQQLERIKKQSFLIIVSELAGCIASVASVILIAKCMGASDEIALSLAPKSVTTPIAMEVSRSIGGIAPLTASVVIVVGILGSVYGYTIMRWSGIKNPVSQGLSMGTAAHAVGTSRSLEISPRFGAFASLGLIVNGIFTALLTPYIWNIIKYFLPN